MKELRCSVVVDFTYNCGKAVFFAYSFAQSTSSCPFINPESGPYSWCSPFLCWYVESGRNKYHCSRVFITAWTAHSHFKLVCPLWSTQTWRTRSGFFFLPPLELEFPLQSLQRIIQQSSPPSLDFMILHVIYCKTTYVYTSTKYWSHTKINSK